MRPRAQWGQGWPKGVIITMKRGFQQSSKILQKKIQGKRTLFLVMQACPCRYDLLMEY
jgi:hypothetical protein